MFSTLCAAILVTGLILAGCQKEEETKTKTPTKQDKKTTVEKQDAKPEVKHEVKPDVKPEAKTSERQKTTWADAKVGDMVKHKMVNNTTMTKLVTKVDEQFVYIKMTTKMDGKELNSLPQEMPRFVQPVTTPVAGTKPEIKDLGTETLTIAGKKIKCKITEMKITFGGKTTTYKNWNSDEVLGGMVKSMSDSKGTMQVMQELVEFKTGE